MNILFFSPYTLWGPHPLWEVTMAYALRQRGHTIRFVTCGGLPECGMAPRTRYDHEQVCAECTRYTHHNYPQLRHQAAFFQEQVAAEERQALADWTNSLADADLRTARYNGLPLGEWCWPDMISYWHNLEPDFARPEVPISYRNLLLGAATASVALPRLFDAFRPEILLTVNGAFFLHRVAYELALQRGIRVITHERGWLTDTLCFNDNALIGDMGRYLRRWEQWKEIPLTREECSAVDNILQQRRKGVNMGWPAFSPSPQDLSAARTAADLPDKPIALLCTTSDCEGSIANRAPAVPQWEWIVETVDWFRAHPEFALVIRVHPNERDHAAIDDRPLRRYQALKAGLPENCRLILPEEPISTYTLMDLASVGLSYGSTAGLEMACLGLPSLHSGLGFYKDAGFMRELTGLADIPEAMTELLTRPRCQQTRRLAFRFLYRLFIGSCIPLSKVTTNRDYTKVSLNYQSTAELAPGRDPQLDRIAEFILGSADLFPPPVSQDWARSAAEENAFFAQKDGAALVTAA